ncbi:unnamed protein product [Cuscuta epithymum]|uniref:Uncharacterized protein n=1 Tax=Cuscuta epithymum TaxID=186058 RepID=A0AAV0D7G9_9ASTE|nr:unnamed protein product [Cuscuta epithymum]
MPGGLRGRRPNPSAPAVSPRFPRRMRRQLARLPLLLPIVPPDPRRLPVPEVRLQGPPVRRRKKPKQQQLASFDANFGRIQPLMNEKSRRHRHGNVRAISGSG